MKLFNRKTKLEKAINVLCKALDKDNDYFNSWQASIAMSFKDEWQRKRSEKKYLNAQDVHNIANKAASNFLETLIKH